MCETASNNKNNTKKKIKNINTKTTLNKKINSSLINNPKNTNIINSKKIMKTHERVSSNYNLIKPKIQNNINIQKFSVFIIEQIIII